MRVLTYNCGLLRLRGLGMPGPATERPERGSRAREIGVALRELDADIICLQEVFSATSQREILEELAPTHAAHARHSNASAIRMSHGLLTITRGEILTSGFTPYEAALPGEKLVIQRGVLEASIEIPGGDVVRILNTHTTAGALTGMPRSATTQRVRSAQLGEMTALARAGEVPVIACGDLNTGPEASLESYLELLGEGWSDAYVDAAFHGSEHVTTWEPRNAHPISAIIGSPASRIDHILLDEAAERALDVVEATILLDEAAEETPGGYPLSDHYALLVELEVHEQRG